VSVGVRLDLSDDVLEAIAQRAAEIVLERLDGQTNGSPWLTIREAADYLHTSTRNVHRFVEHGRLRPSYGTGRRPLFRRDDLDRIATAGEDVAPTTSPRRRED
jgi:excisionase family DNA binding protein